jgi:AmmeMemoRadiSam system protein B
MAAVLLAARALGGDRVTVLSYRNSGDVSGDRSRVVGYSACAITAS